MLFINVPVVFPYLYMHSLETHLSHLLHNHLNRHEVTSMKARTELFTLLKGLLASCDEMNQDGCDDILLDVVLTKKS
jgi:hypothetical protein